MATQPTQPLHQAGFELIDCIGPAGMLLEAAHCWIWLDIVLRVLVAIVRVAECMGKPQTLPELAISGIFSSNSHQKAVKVATNGNRAATHYQTLSLICQQPFWDVLTPKIDFFLVLTAAAGTFIPIGTKTILYQENRIFTLNPNMMFVWQ
ncbi:hypothetical protein BDN70DRAFT_939286 [Pholiota conissans]|uniref:Uncharacterized protein n=1 Tax=Pholiota conissans TaxID=109636 RepID=A0A9P5YNT7_9AGAR|nr:hypothetical protein BDN70DRAFT_939286 [Pholiota conissans]